MSQEVKIRYGDIEEAISKIKDINLNIIKSTFVEELRYGRKYILF